VNHQINNVVNAKVPYIILIIITAIVIALGFTVSAFTIHITLAQVLSLAGIFFFVSALFLLIILRKTSRPQESIRLFLAGSFVKLMLYVILLLAMVVIFKHNRIVLVISFLSLYLVYTPFDIWVLLKYFQKPG